MPAAAQELEHRGQSQTRGGSSPIATLDAQGAQGLSRPLLAIMAVAAGVGIANLYYNQPLLEQMRADMHAGDTVIGLVPTLTQIGYAVGMLLLVPLGDMFSRKWLALLFAFLAACMSVGIALSTSSAMRSVGVRCLPWQRSSFSHSCWR